ncbi:MAG: chitobiase/beta-hexosaminidase C-terminal domain-containing protein [Candidatus Stygibacter frigidus]|nr:chitobiase/beta-hexosaminidase C-terminal domain-containing protein [Candidatus Stygibacter frigidus]
MKKIILVFLLVIFVLLGCDKKTSEPENEAPFIPSSPIPPNGYSQLGIETDIAWSCSDPDGDALTYDVYFGTDPTPNSGELVSSSQSGMSFNPGTMQYETTYYWKIAATDGEYDISSPVWSFTTVPTQSVATPIFNPSGGSYTSPLSVSISCSTSGATIRYTTNGSFPTILSAIYSSPINILTTTTLNAKSYKSGLNESNIASENYTINQTQMVATPAFNPSGGSYTLAQNVTISCSTSGATIRYTTNGNDPTSSSTTYSTSINISSTTTLKAKAFKSGWNESQVVTTTYTITVPSMVEIGSCGDIGTARKIVKYENYLYILCDFSGIKVIDVSDSSNPIQVGSYTLFGLSGGIAIRGDKLFVSDEVHDDIIVFSLTDPSSPQWYNFSNVPGGAMGILISGDYLYAASGNIGLRIYQIDDFCSPSDLDLIGTCNTPGYAKNVAVNGSYAYIADFDGGLRIINISDKYNPYEVGYYLTWGEATGVSANGSVVYVTEYDDGFTTVNVSSPTNPNIYDNYNTSGGPAMGFQLVGDYAYVADGTNGVRILNVNDVSNITEQYSYDTPGCAWDLCVDGIYIYVADSGGGLRVLQFSAKK